MRRIVLFVGILIVVAAAQAQSADAIIQQHCSSEWPSDYTMQAYCVRQQRQAVQDLQQLTAGHGKIPVDAYKLALSGCVQEWPDDFQMQAYCLRQQIKGYSDVSRSPSSPLVEATPVETAVIKQHCGTEWPSDYQMQAYCEGQQMDGLGFLKNRPSSISSGVWVRATQACAGEWPDGYQMQAYCVRQILKQ